MTDIVWSLLYRLPDASDEQFAEMRDMAQLWADHLRGPGGHDGRVVLLSNVSDPIEGAESIPIEAEAGDRRAIFAMRPPMALKHLPVGAEDRGLQVDIDALARHPLRPVFDAIEPGQMRVSPSMLPLAHPQQVGRLLGVWGHLWHGCVRGWRRKPGVSAAVTACLGQDWPTFMGAWADVIQQYADVRLKPPRPGDQGYLNYLYGFGKVPMRRFGPEHVHHLRMNDRTPHEQIDAAAILHFPLPDKLKRMQEWSRL